MSRKDILNILIIGGGGREHAIGWKVKQSLRCGELYFLPGNAGTAVLGKNIPFLPPEWKALPDLVRALGIDLVIVGPELPLSEGVVDILRVAGIAVVGPTQKAAQIETSKAFAKALMRDTGIPTAPFQIFDDFGRAKGYVRAKRRPFYIKASGLAGGKGAFPCHTVSEAERVLHRLMEERELGEAAEEVVVEEFLDGEEVSVHAFCHGNLCIMAPPTQDHKRLLADGECRADGSNPNTGGMGAIGPVPWVSEEEILDMRDIVERTLRGVKGRTKEPFTGILYPGLMMTAEGPKVLEYNVRGGDPETQVLMRLLSSDAVDLFEAMATGRLDTITVWWPTGQFAVCITLAGRGYPEVPETGALIDGIEEAEDLEGVVVFHAGTRNLHGHLQANGGRVLSVTATGQTLVGALAQAYRAVDKICFDGMQYRKDIGRKAAAGRMEETLASV